MNRKTPTTVIVREVLEAPPHLQGDHWRLYWAVVARYVEIPEAVRDFVLNRKLPNYETVRRASRASKAGAPRLPRPR